MPFVPGPTQDPLFEAVKGVITSDTPEGQYARSALGFDPSLDESVRMVEISSSAREADMEALSRRMGTQGPPGFYYGQRAYYGGEEYRIESFQERANLGGSPKLMLTLVDDGFGVRLRGVDAASVTVPTSTTAMGEDVDGLEEALGPGVVKELTQMTKYNQHTEALVLIAKDVLKDRKLTKAMNAVMVLHEYFGSMPNGLHEVRTAIYKRILATAKSKLSPEDYKAVHGAL